MCYCLTCLLFLLNMFSNGNITCSISYVLLCSMFNIIWVTYIVSCVLLFNAIISCIVTCSVRYVLLFNAINSVNVTSSICYVLLFNMFYNVSATCSSSIRIMTCAIVQSSGIRPTVFILFIIDLQVIGHTNHVTNYIYNCSQLMPDMRVIDKWLEFQQVLKYVGKTNFWLKLLKTKEMVFHWPNPRNYLPAAELPGI